jgi:dTDP-glucose pyrophosphorylase/predicted transcriptional regulator
MITKNLSLYKVVSNQTLKKTIEVMNKGGIGLCICVNKLNNVVGIFTDGDFRRAILNGKKLNSSIEKLVNKNFDYLKKNHNNNQIEKIFQKNKAKHIPVLNKNKLIGIIVYEYYERIITNKTSLSKNKNIAVIMAGGKGSRLDPFTRILPKPLIPIGNDPIIKLIQNEFELNGVNKFIISINHKSEILKTYFKNEKSSSQIDFLQEKKPLGTIGVLSKLKKNIKETLFVSNCDIIIKENYNKILDFHKKNKFKITIVGSAQQHSVPYGVCSIDKKGKLIEIKEKPNFDLIVNTGFYLLEPQVLNFIPKNKFFDMTDLIQILLDKKIKIGVFPVNENAWIDIGHWSEYKKSLQKYNFK